MNPITVLNVFILLSAIATENVYSAKISRCIYRGNDKPSPTPEEHFKQCGKELNVKCYYDPTGQMDDVECNVSKKEDFDKMKECCEKVGFEMHTDNRHL